MRDVPANDAPFRLLAAVAFGEDVVVGPFTNLYGCEIGDGTRIGPFVEVQAGARIGARCKVQSHTFVCDGVTIGDGVFVGHGVVFVNDRRPRATAGGRLQTDGGLDTAADRRRRRGEPRLGRGDPRRRGDRRRRDGRRGRGGGRRRRARRDRRRRAGARARRGPLGRAGGAGAVSAVDLPGVPVVPGVPGVPGPSGVLAGDDLRAIVGPRTLEILEGRAPAGACAGAAGSSGGCSSPRTCAASWPRSRWPRSSSTAAGRCRPPSGGCCR